MAPNNEWRLISKNPDRLPAGTPFVLKLIFLLLLVFCPYFPKKSEKDLGTSAEFIAIYGGILPSKQKPSS